MAFQTEVRKKLAIGMEGEFYDDSPRRVSPYIVSAAGGSEVVEFSAIGEIFINGNPQANDTVTIGDITYKFAAGASEANDVAIGNTAADSAANLAQVIRDSYNTVLNGNIETSGTTITLITSAAGEAANNTVLSADGGARIGYNAFSGGRTETITDGANTAYIGRVFTSVEGKPNACRCGGRGTFLGIAVNPKNYPVSGGLSASLALQAGAAAQLCRMGLVFVRVKTAVEPNEAAYYDADTGEIGGASIGGYSIPNAVFKFFPASAGEIAVLQITD